MKRLALALVLVVLLAACGSKNTEQSFREGMALICKVGEDPDLAHANPVERQAAMSRWLDERVTNARARKVIAAVGEANPQDRARLIREAAGEAGVTDCPIVAEAAPGAGLELPTVPGDVALAEVPEGVTMVITATAIVVEGEQIVAVRDGAVDPSELDGGARGMKVTRLEKFAGALAAQDPGPMLVAVAPGTPYRVLMQALYSVKGSYQALHVLARAGDALGAVSLTLPTAPLASGVLAPAPDAEPPVQMVLAITQRHALLWSLSGTEGTLRQPALTVAPDDVTRVRAALADIAKRRWEGRARPDEDRRIVVMADATQPAAIVVPMMAAARESFPDVVLSTGFE